MSRSTEYNRYLSMKMRVAIVATCIFAILIPRLTMAQEANVAGLVIDYGDNRVSYAIIPFEEERINGVDLLNRSGLDIVTVGFGGMGDAVCQIDDTGCPVDECRARMCQTSDPDSAFWQFSKLSGDGTWQLVATGASGARVQDGDIYGWSWTGTDPDLPVLSIDELAARAGGDLDSLGGNALLQTEGGETGESGNVFSLTSILAVGVVVVGAGFLVLRSRRPASSRNAG
jgi:hypothetical protein